MGKKPTIYSKNLFRVNSNYWPVPSIQTDEVKAIRNDLGSEGVDVYFMLLSKLCTCDYLTFNIGKPHLREVFCTEVRIPLEDFTSIVEYMVFTLEIFDVELYRIGYLFCPAILENLISNETFQPNKFLKSAVVRYVESLKGNEDPRDEIDKDDDLPF